MTPFSPTDAKLADLPFFGPLFKSKGMEPLADLLVLGQVNGQSKPSARKGRGGPGRKKMSDPLAIDIRQPQRRERNQIHAKAGKNSQCQANRRTKTTATPRPFLSVVPAPIDVASQHSDLAKVAQTKTLGLIFQVRAIRNIVFARSVRLTSWIFFINHLTSVIGSVNHEATLLQPPFVCMRT